MEKKKCPKFKIPKEIKEIVHGKDKTCVNVMCQEDIDSYNRSIGHRIARMKRYGHSASYRKRKENEKDQSKQSLI